MIGTLAEHNYTAMMRSESLRAPETRLN